VAFPDPRKGDDEGLIAIGGDLSERRLLAAYSHGIFPWYSQGFPVLWWSPNPRAVLEAENLHVARSMRRKLSKGDFVVTWNRAFAEVIRACGEEREGGTWIVPEMREAYLRLHRAGRAHSIDVWFEGALVGGLYGVQCGALFSAESMFHRATDASKVALIVASRSLARAGIEIFDVQFVSAHLRSLGVGEISRNLYLDRVAVAAAKSVDLSGLSLVLDP
jgi:leucyl/phenylalanyl-tRNA--protein transferase